MIYVSKYVLNLFFKLSYYVTSVFHIQYIQKLFAIIGEVDFKLLPLNVRGIRYFHKRKSIFTWISKQKADITLLQETYSTPDIVNDCKFQWRGDMLFTHGSNHSKGVLILFHEQIQYEVKNSTIDPNGRYICFN